jgi:cytochrome c
MKDAGRFGAFIAVLLLAGSTASPGYAQDGAHGKSVFKACAACHATDHTNRVGPGLEGIVGRTAGTAPGFRYSNAMKNSNGHALVADEPSTKVVETMAISIRPVTRAE